MSELMTPIPYRELVGIDEEAENAHILEAAKKLWGDLNHREY